MSGCARKEATIFVDPVLQGDEDFGQAHGQKTLGADHGRAGRQGVGGGEEGRLAWVAGVGPPGVCPEAELFTSSGGAA